MKTDIVLAGVGGQGILTIATILGAAALKENLYLKQAEVHGMSQRGGDVQSNLRISSSPIHSDLIPQGGAALIVSLEPLSSISLFRRLDSDEHGAVCQHRQLSGDDSRGDRTRTSAPRCGFQHG